MPSLSPGFIQHNRPRTLEECRISRRIHGTSCHCCTAFYHCIRTIAFLGNPYLRPDDARTVVCLGWVARGDGSSNAGGTPPYEDHEI